MSHTCGWLTDIWLTCVSLPWCPTEGVGPLISSRPQDDSAIAQVFIVCRFLDSERYLAVFDVQYRDGMFTDLQDITDLQFQLVKLHYEPPCDQMRYSPNGRREYIYGPAR